MVLHQAEQEGTCFLFHLICHPAHHPTPGYSVFAVVQADPSAPLALPRTEADELATRLPEPTSATSARLSTTTTPAVKQPSASSFTPQTHHAKESFEDEDMELQAVLQASLMWNNPDDLHSPEPPPFTRSYMPRIPGSWPESSSRSGSGPDSGAGTPTRYTRRRYGVPNDLSNLSRTPDVDRVAESMARNRAIMQRMLREQEMAQRELYHEEVRRSMRTEEEDEAEMLRNAIAESQALARVEGHGQPANDDDDGDDDDKGEMQDEEYNGPVMEQESAHRLPSIPIEDRVYDDDDEELQRALKASLEAVPQGFTMPDLRSAPVRMPLQEVEPNPVQIGEETDLEETDTSSEAEASIVSMPSSDVPQESEVVSVDELRRRRLARFGGLR
jgi:ataxin-3